MFHTRPYRWARISATAVCLLVFGLSAWLWIRSYYAQEEVYWKVPPLKAIGTWSNAGRIVITIHAANDGGLSGIHHIHYGDGTNWVAVRESIDKNYPNILGFGIGPRFDNTYVMLPHWLLVLVAAATIAIPWLGWQVRFSLRSMLIAVTVVALVLGAFVWLLK